MAKIVKMQDGENPDMVLVPQTDKFSILLNSKNGVTSQIDLNSTSVSILKTMLKEWEGKHIKTSDSNCIIPVVSESFTNVCRILLSKDVKIEHNLDGFKKFVVNGEMCHSTKMVYKKLIS